MKLHGKVKPAFWFVGWRRSHWLGVFMVLAGCLGGLSWHPRSLAEAPPSPRAPARQSLPADPPLAVNALQPGQTPPGVISSKTISPTRLTIPSLWWVQEQIESVRQAREKEELQAQLDDLETQGKTEVEKATNKAQLNGQPPRPLILDWLAFPITGEESGRVDLVVDRQLWGRMDYLQRYQFIHSFSAIARSYGYNIRVFNNQAAIVAAFTCKFGDLDLRLIQLSNELAGTPGLRSDMITYSRNPVADQLRCTMTVETGTGAFLRRTSTPFK